MDRRWAAPLVLAAQLLPANAAEPPFKGLTVALLFSDGGPDSGLSFLNGGLPPGGSPSDMAGAYSEVLDRNSRLFLEGGLPLGGEGTRVTEAYRAMLQRNFANTLTARSLQEAKDLQADLIARLEVRGDIEPRIRVTSELRLMTPEEELIDVIRSQSPEAPGEADASAVISRNADELERELLASRKLSTYAGGAAPPPEAPPRPRSDVDAPAFRLKERPDDFALVVGVEKYRSLPDARFAASDAAAVRRHLLALGYPERNVISLEGDSATLTGMRKYLEEWLPKNVTPRSTVFFYFAGHGAPDPETRRAFLVPWDGDPDFIETTGYPLERLHRSLERLRAARVIAALDSCFAGAGGRSVLPRGARPLVARPNLGSPAGKTILFSAASGSQISGVLEDRGHGLFTYYFLKGLESAVAGEPEVTAGWIFSYLKPKVEEAARRQNRRQIPALAGPPEAVVAP